MTATPPPPLDKLPEAIPIQTRRLSPSLVWLIPLLAAVIGLWLAGNAILSRGPEVTIQFSSGLGLEAGKTRIKYRNVEIGEVTAVSLSADRSHIEVSARLVKEARPWLVEDSRFWVVRPRVSGGTVTGLDTVLSGAYIAMDVGHSTRSLDRFVGLEQAPIITGDWPGRRFVLVSDELGSLEIGSPVYYRRVPVGQVVGYRLADDGRGVIVTVFINQPYDRYVSVQSRFWHASGLNVSLGANGLKLDAQSLVSIALGGVAFDSPAGDILPPEAASNTLFMLAPNREQALRQLETRMRKFQLRFHESVRGLSVGAPVDFRGIAIGEVTGIGLEPPENRESSLIVVDIQVYPKRLQIVAGSRPSDKTPLLPVLKKAIAKGLRAQLRMGSMLTGQRYVALDYFPDAPKAYLQQSADSEVLPTRSGELQELQHILTRIASSIDRMQLDVLGSQMHETLTSLNTTLKHTDQLVQGVNQNGLPQALATLKSLQQALDSASNSMSPEAPLQQELRDAARQVSAAARSIQTLSDTLERNPEAILRGKPGDKKQ